LKPPNCGKRTEPTTNFDEPSKGYFFRRVINLRIIITATAANNIHSFGISGLSGSRKYVRPRQEREKEAAKKRENKITSSPFSVFYWFRLLIVERDDLFSVARKLQLHFLNPFIMIQLSRSCFHLLIVRYDPTIFPHRFFFCGGIEG
jgi:hypothetical protein